MLNGWRERIAERVPLPFLTKPYELGLSLALMCLALPQVLLVAINGTTAPDPLITGWGYFTLVGGLLTWVGIFRDRPRWEWSGQLLSGYSLAYIALVLALFDFTTRYASVTVFAILSVVSFWTAWRITSQSLIQARLVLAARKAHVRVTEERAHRRRTT